MRLLKHFAAWLKGEARAPTEGLAGVPGLSVALAAWLPIWEGTRDAMPGEGGLDVRLLRAGAGPISGVVTVDLRSGGHQAGVSFAVHSLHVMGAGAASSEVMAGLETARLRLMYEVATAELGRGSRDDEDQWGGPVS